jgi:hypothetical protein
MTNKEKLNERRDEYLNIGDIVDRFKHIDEVYNHSPWNLEQIFANLNILISKEINTEDRYFKSKEDTKYIRQDLKYMREECKKNIYHCRFWFTTPKLKQCIDMKADESIKTITDIFNKYGFKIAHCDTLDGSYCLDREWFFNEKPIDCHVSFGYVAPLCFTEEEILTIIDLEYSGKLIIMVDWCNENGERICGNQ